MDQNQDLGSNTGNQNKFVWLFLSFLLVAVVAGVLVFTILNNGSEAEDLKKSSGQASEQGNINGEAENSSQNLVEVPQVGQVEISAGPKIDVLNMDSSTGPYITDQDPFYLTKAPEISGTDFANNIVEIKPDGKIKVVYFFAHWCPHCQQEMPKVQSLVDDGLFPDEADLYGISTIYQGPDSAGDEPAVWFANEKWSSKVIRDSADDEIFKSYGGQGVPYVVVLDGENNILARASGMMDDQDIVKLWQYAVSS